MYILAYNRFPGKNRPALSAPVFACHNQRIHQLFLKKWVHPCTFRCILTGLLRILIEKEEQTEVFVCRFFYPSAQPRCRIRPPKTR